MNIKIVILFIIVGLLVILTTSCSKENQLNCNDNETIICINNTNCSCMNQQNSNLSLDNSSNSNDTPFFCVNKIPFKIYWEDKDLEQEKAERKERIIQNWYFEDEAFVYYKSYNSIGGESFSILNKITEETISYRIYPDEYCIKSNDFQPPYFGIIYSYDVFEGQDFIGKPYPYNGEKLIGRGIMKLNESKTKIVNGLTCVDSIVGCINQEYCMQIEKIGYESNKIILKIEKDFDLNVFNIPNDCE